MVTLEVFGIGALKTPHYFQTWIFWCFSFLFASYWMISSFGVAHLMGGSKSHAAMEIPLWATLSLVLSLPLERKLDGEGSFEKVYGEKAA